MKKRQLTKLQFWLIYSAVVVVSVVLDQLTKFLLEEPLKDGVSIPIIGDWMTLWWTYNPGSAFGMFKGQTVLFFVFLMVGIPLFLFLMAYSRKRSVFGQIGFSFMLGGAIGNAIDRMFLGVGEGFYHGLVRDFIRVRGFAVFNIADSFLVVGTILACLALLFFDHDSVFRPLFEKKSNFQVGETPVDELPTDELPVDETPADELPVDFQVDETPADELPVDETPADKLPVEKSHEK